MALDNEKLREFTRKVLECSQDGEDAHGADIHDWAVEAGLLIAHPITQPCDPDHCRCAEFGIFEDSVCFRMAPELQESPMRSDEGTVALPYAPDVGRTHYDGCWKDRGHHNCAVLHIATLTAEVERVRGERDGWERRTKYLGSVVSRAWIVLRGWWHYETEERDDEPFVEALERAVAADRAHDAYSLAEAQKWRDATATARADALKEVREECETELLRVENFVEGYGIIDTVILEEVLALLDAKMRGDATAPAAPAASPSRPAGAPAGAGESHPTARSPADG